MIWFYQRDGVTIRLETSYDNDTKEYVLVVIDAAGQASVERFSQNNAFEQRLRAIESKLSADAWNLTGSPQFFPEGFPRQTPER